MMRFPMSNIRRSLSTATAGFLLLIAACGGPRELTRPETPYAMPPAATRFFTTAYDQINDKYLQPLPMSDIANAGLGNLRKLDPMLSVTTSAEHLDVAYDGTNFASFDRPRRDDAYRWAQITVAAVDASRDKSSSVRTADTETIYQTIIEGAISRLDTYSRYSTREAARDARASRDGFGGIGITIDGKEGKVRVVAVIDETPAARSGLKADDVIVSIDGTSTEGLETKDVVRKLRGPIGNPVSIGVTRSGAKAPLPFTVTRALIVPPSVIYKREGNAAYVHLLGFNQRTTDALADAVRRAKREIGPDMSGLIVDLRGNLGGLLDQAISVSDFFLPAGEIVSTRGRHRASGQVSSAGRGDAGEDFPLVVLVNGASASASEIVAAALQDNGRAVVIGTTTFGKGSVQTVIPMPNEGELILTWARFFAPSGYPIADLGVTPAICTSRDEPVGNYINAVRTGHLTEPATMAEWRSADHNNMARIKQLRAICQPDTKEHDADLEVARQLLSDRTLYARALQSVTVAAKAK
jgi:carboxyl-terminal processing protease